MNQDEARNGAEVSGATIRPSGSSSPPLASAVGARAPKGARAHARRRPRYVRLSVLVAGIVLILIASAMYLALPAERADFRIHAKTSFVAFRADADHNITIESSDWDAIGIPADSHDDHTMAVSRSPGNKPNIKTPDRIEIAIHANDVVQIEADDQVPFRYLIFLPSRAAMLSIQSESGAPLYSIADNGQRVAIANSAPAYQMKAGERAGYALRVTLPECVISIGHVSRGDATDPDAGRLPLPGCAHGIADRLRVDQLGFGKPGTDGVAVGLLGGGLQFLDNPNSEFALYRGTDLRLGIDDAEITALELARDGIGVYATGSTQAATLNVETRDRGVTAHSIMPTRLDGFKGTHSIAITVSVLATIVGIIGFILSVAGVIKPFGSWLHRVLEMDEPTEGDIK